MSLSDRPGCRAPDSCKSKSHKLCAGCSGTKVLAEIAADPERAARRANLSMIARDCAQYRAQQGDKLKRLWDDPEYRAAMSARARRSVAAMVDNVEIRHKRAESVRRSLADPEVRKRRNQILSASLARKLAAQIGIPVELVPLYRVMRHKVRLAPAEAKSTVLASREAATFFAEQARAMAMRAAGPAPAIGTSARIAWSRKVNRTRNGEARPC